MVESTSDLNKSLEKVEDWYRVVIFTKDCEVIAKKNMEKVDQKELR